MVKFEELGKAKEYLTSLGFHEYDPPSFMKYDSAVAYFQKRYDDKVGKKYFINAKIWDFTFSNRISDKYVIEYDGQYYKFGTHDSVNMEFIGWEIEDVEIWLDKLFSLGVLEHYERWGY